MKIRRRKNFITSYSRKIFCWEIINNIFFNIGKKFCHKKGRSLHYLHQRFRTFLGWFPTWLSSNYLFPPIPFPLPPLPTRIPHASRWHKINVFDIPLCIALVITVKPVIAQLGDRLQTSGIGAMRCLLLSGEMNGRVREVHHSHLCNPLVPPRGGGEFAPGWEPLT